MRKVDLETIIGMYMLNHFGERKNKQIKKYTVEYYNENSLLYEPKPLARAIIRYIEFKLKEEEKLMFGSNDCPDSYKCKNANPNCNDYLSCKLYSGDSR